MTDITQCPQCGTHFKITDEQRNAHEGLVRCGRCQTVFNAVENLYIPPQQLDLPLILDDISNVTGLHAVYDPYATDDSSVSISAEAAARRANDFSHIPDVYFASQSEPVSRRASLLLKTSSLFLVLIILLEVAYFFRVEIAARLPGIKPVMLQICAKLKCNLPLPQKIDLISIESSELEADPTQANIITLHALLRSRAPYPMVYPDIELTLTDIQDNAVARRTFSPADYLPPHNDGRLGFPANREAAINLHLDTTDLKPAGYRLFLYYPQ
ncbi:MAG: DUF3426 domain-containing protein [Gallionellaceae bacterium]